MLFQATVRHLLATFALLKTPSHAPLTKTRPWCQGVGAKPTWSLAQRQHTWVERDAERTALLFFVFFQFYRG